MSKGFFEFVKSIGEAKSKQEEDGIIENELHILKAKMGARNVGPRQMREYLIRMVYVEMLGHDASFGHIHAVKLTRASKLVDKRVGYMACSLCLHKDHELMLLLVGGLQTDLQSQNQLEVSTALVVSCKLINEDTIPAILPLVNKLLNHSEATIRKKAIMVIQRFNELSDSSVTDVADKAKRMLCDKDPSVMGASLHLLLDLVRGSLNDFSDLVSSFVSILKQIIEHRLPKDYDYHRMPAPWTQIKLLQILSVLGTANKSASEGMYEVLHEVMRRADIGINVGYAIIYECVRTVTTIYPNTQLLAEAAKCTSRFITSENHNLKYLGINALASIVQINPSAANEHQMIVIDCLEDKDETLRRKTLDLLYKMTNENNVNVICTKLLLSLQDSVDVYLRTQLVEKITFLAEKFAPDTIWFIDTMARVFELGADLVKPQFAHNFVKTLAEGIVENAEDEESEEDIANYAADFFYQILVANLKKKRKRIPHILMRIVAWVLGEYGQSCTGKPVDAEEDEDDEDEVVALSPMEIIRTLWTVIEKQGDHLSTRQWAMSATCKLVRHLDHIPAEMEQIVEKYKTSAHSDLVQLSYELMQLCTDKEMMDYCFTEASVVDEVKVDQELSFLDSYVAGQRAQGKRAYAPPDDYDEDELEDNKGDTGLRIGQHRTAMDDMASVLAVKSVPQSDNYGNPGMGGYGDDEPEQSNEVQQTVAEPQIGIKKVGRAKGPWGDHVGRDSDSDDAQAVVAQTQSKYDNAVITVHDPFDNRNYARKDNSVPVNQSSGSSSKREPMSEKEQQAAWLFGGNKAPEKTKKGRRVRKKKILKKGGSGTSSPKKKMVKKKLQRPSSPVPDPPQSQPDLLGLYNDAPAKVQPAAPVKTEQPDLLGGLFDDMTSMQPVNNAQTSAPAQPQNQSAAPANDDLLGGLFDSMGAAPPASSAMDPIGGGLLDSLTPSQPASPTNALDVSSPLKERGFAALKSRLGASVMGFPRSHETDQVLFENGTLQVSYLKLFKQHKSTLCLFLSNLSAQPLQSVEVSVTTDNGQGLQVGFDASNSLPPPQLRKATTAVLQTLGGGATACQMVSVGVTQPGQVTVCNLVVRISIGGSNLGPLKVSLKMSDLMRASVISTQDFGQNWGKLAAGSFSGSVKSASASNGAYVNAVVKQLHIHHIETIGGEVISAGQLSSSTNPNMLLPILVHCKCAQGAGYAFIVRTPSAVISKAIGLELQQILSA